MRHRCAMRPRGRRVMRRRGRGGGLVARPARPSLLGWRATAAARRQTGGMRACPNGHPIDDDRARICPACGSLLVPLEAAAAQAARAEAAGAAGTDAAGTTRPESVGTADGSGRESAADPAPARHERISAPVLGLALAVIAVAIGLFAAWMAMQQPRPGPSPGTSPLTYEGGPAVIVE